MRLGARIGRVAAGIAPLAALACSDADVAAPWRAVDVGLLDASADAAMDAGMDGAVCEADVRVDPAHCGACDHPCAPGQRCDDGACVCEPADAVSFSADLEPFFVGRCAKGMCHANGMGAVGLDLGDGAAYESLVGVASEQCDDGRKRVLPGAPEESYLVHKLLGVRLCTGSAMPTEDGLAADELRPISDWICQGALADR